MAWDPKYPAFGVIKIEGKIVKMYSSRDNYTSLSFSVPVKNAVWAGNFLNVTLADGKVRRYSSRDSYSTI
ncbi:MAG: hypothetical protein EBX50_14485 [Chitinophagia bacterium]|nr:hypothetical protein [Chitinophagia bacterium]